MTASLLTRAAAPVRSEYWRSRQGSAMRSTCDRAYRAFVPQMRDFEGLRLGLFGGNRGQTQAVERHSVQTIAHINALRTAG